MRIAIVYASDEGQTGRIAHYLVEEFTRLQAFASAVHFEDIPDDWDLHDYDMVIVGASIHSGEFQPYALDWLREHCQHLAAKHNGFYCVSLMQKDAEQNPRARATVQGYLSKMVKTTGWHPEFVASFAGALRYRKYGFFKRWFLRRVLLENQAEVAEGTEVEYTDWAAVRQFAETVMRAQVASI